MHYWGCALGVVLAAIIASCGAEGPADERPTFGSTDLSYPSKSVIHWCAFADWDDAKVREAAEADLIVFPIQDCYSPQSGGILGEIRRLNPDVQIVGYIPLLGVYTLWPDTTYLKTTYPYTLDYYNAVRGDWVWTTAGDTLMIFPELISLNPIKNGAINRDLIDTIVNLIARYQAETGNAVDGVMHDYFAYDIYINPSIRDHVIGDVDLDGNGTTFENDPGERELFILWQQEYAKAIRERLGDDFIQIGNGRPPEEMPGLARYLNGIFYELYPNFPWGKTDRDGLLRLLENQSPGFLTPAKGRTWSICTNEKGNASSNNLFCLMSSLIAGCMYTELAGSYLFNGWSLDISTGAPQGAAVVAGSLDSTLTVSRKFERGEVTISFYPWGGREGVAFEALQSKDR